MEPAPEIPAPPAPGRKRVGVGLAAIIVLGGGGFFAWKHFNPATTPPPPPAKATAGKSVPAPVPAKSIPAVATPTSTTPTPSETLNKLAHLPVNAINKAKDVIATREASGQTRVDAAAIGEEVPDKPSAPVPAAPVKPAAPAPKTATVMTTLAPGLAAGTQVEAAPQASPAFRSFVANAKVSGVFQGTPVRAFINGRMMHVGDLVDPVLGIFFDGVAGDRRQLIFKDKSGATVGRKF